MGITVKNNKPVSNYTALQGKDGKDGVGIKTIESGTPVITEETTTTPITVTLTDETTQEFNVEAQNGSGSKITDIDIEPDDTKTRSYVDVRTLSFMNLNLRLNNEQDEYNASIKLPIIAGTGITMEVNEDNQIVISSSDGTFNKDTYVDVIEFACHTIAAPTTELKGRMVVTYQSDVDIFSHIPESGEEPVLTQLYNALQPQQNTIVNTSTSLIEDNSNFIYNDNNVCFFLPVDGAAQQTTSSMIVGRPFNRIQFQNGRAVFSSSGIADTDGRYTYEIIYATDSQVLKSHTKFGGNQ